ncbi:hypothetical protein [Neokomagataea tanensis]|uniref:hypothetical protein n=1 Tax=Neokomagataea tanensis TaxID=661191 RepID=UPI00147739E9|nr:hypothetical protein [Neokomagataea tanensis]
MPIKMDTAQDARDILDEWQIGINDLANAPIMPCNFHFSNEIHGGQGAQKNYGDLINQYMEEADRLAVIESKSLGGGEPGFKAGRAVVMDSRRRFCDNLTYKSKGPNAIVFQEIMHNVEKGARQLVNGN